MKLISPAKPIRYRNDWYRSRYGSQVTAFIQYLKDRINQRGDFAGHISMADAAWLWFKSGGKANSNGLVCHPYCATCSLPLVTNAPYAFDIDHILPLCRGGKNTRANLQLLCPFCHKVKTRFDRKLNHSAVKKV